MAATEPHYGIHCDVHFLHCTGYDVNCAYNGGAVHRGLVQVFLMTSINKITRQGAILFAKTNRVLMSVSQWVFKGAPSFIGVLLS